MEDTLWKIQRSRMAKVEYLKKYSENSLKEVAEKEPDLVPEVNEDIARSLEVYVLIFNAKGMPNT